MRKIFLFILTVVCFSANAQTTENFISKDSLDNIFKKVIDKNGPATDILILGKSNKVLYKAGFGYADIENKRKADDLTQFNLASISKSFTALAIMQLVERGKLSVTDTIGKFFPNFPKGDKITIHQLLTHTSGLSDSINYIHWFEKAGLKQIPDTSNKENYLKNYLQVLLEGYLNTDGIFGIMQKQPAFEFEPGAKGKWEYSNRGFTALAKVIEKVTGMDFKEYMRQSIFLPLGMKNTFIYDCSNANEIKNYAASYIPTQTGWRKVFNLVPGGEGDGNIYTTLDDWILYEKCLSGGFPKVISKNSLKEIFKKQVLVNSNQYIGFDMGLYYGYGWFINDVDSSNGGQAIWHTGGNVGVYCYREHETSANLTIVIFSTSPFWKLVNEYYSYLIRNGIIKE